MGLRIELRGECEDLSLVHAQPTGPIELADGIVFEELLGRLLMRHVCHFLKSTDVSGNVRISKSSAAGWPPAYLQSQSPPCPLLALSGRTLLRCKCLLSGVKRTWRFALHMSAYDPKRTF